MGDGGSVAGQRIPVAVKLVGDLCQREKADRFDRPVLDARDPFEARAGEFGQHRVLLGAAGSQP